METKWCFWCGDRKDIDEFSKDRWQEDGRCPKCKSCTNKHRKEYRANNLMEVRAKDRKKIQRFPRTALQRKIRREASIRWREKNPDKWKASLALRTKVGSGEIDREKCEFCDTDKKTHGHHEDYSRVFDVMWLCPGCHVKWHRAKKIIHNPD